MKKSFTAILLLNYLLIIDSCTFRCGNGSLNLAFVGFNQADIDTVILRKYGYSSSYSHFIDSVVIDERVARYVARKDTTILNIAIGDLNYYITPNFDWQVYIPAINKTVLISNIISEDIRRGSKRCTNPIQSFMQDGKIVIPEFAASDTFYLRGYRAYIAK